MFGSDRRGVAAPHVVLLDVEVGHRVGVGRLVEHQVLVVLHGVGLDGAPTDPDQTGVDRP